MMRLGMGLAVTDSTAVGSGEGDDMRLQSLTVATMGDSYNALGFTNTATSKSYANNNTIFWLRALLGGRIHMPLDNNLAVGGTYAAQIAATASAVIATGAKLVFLDAGRNDFAAGTGYAAVLSAIMPAIAQILNSGIDVIWYGVPAHTTNMTATIYKNIEEYNRTLMEICSGLRPDLCATYNFPLTRLPVYVDQSYAYDFTSGAGRTGYIISDGVHKTAKFCFHEAQQLAPILQGMLTPRPQFFNGYNDIYDATNHPHGNIMLRTGTNDGLLNGTSGAKTLATSMTPTGSFADGFQALRSIGTSTATYVGSKEGTIRGDGLNSGGQIIQIDGAADGVNGELYSFNYINAAFGIQTNIIPGALVTFGATYEILDAPTGVLGVQINLNEQGNASNISASDGAANTDTSAYGPDMQHRGFLRTPPFIVSAATTTLNPNTVITTDGRQAVHLRVAIRDMFVRYL